MKLIYVCLVLLTLSCKPHIADQHAPSEIKAKNAIKEVLANQEIAWNNHDLEGFMQGYWKNDSLKFYGSKGLTLGWDKTLANYKKGYPSKAESGTLKFVINDISKIENSAYIVFGEFHLERTIGNANGIFTIIFKYIDGQWKIVADMSC
ncbi:YybH family protein [Gelidibacter salicanalis]|uniref:Nuclear transport factor 2 family protein n=1 Tax=Gelidibacter salicanalis TaxID=291193 RepID=A0A934NJK1_9FLAO|nr:nuclear transport factor 2 family protein [Gelidibacter salicanalis]MBJ7881519.1 nuclear transport factor 2 family protein [Gelidibacter salicanalis]